MITSYPFENQIVSETQFSHLFRELQDSGVAGEVGGNLAFHVASDGSGLDLQIAPGFAVVRGHAVNSDIVETRVLGAAHATLPRIDRIVLRLDPTANSVTLTVLAGTPATPAVAPALTQTETGVYELHLADVQVNPSSLHVAQVDITDTRQFLGHRGRNWTTTTRPTGTSRRKGSFGYNSTTNKWEFWNGTAWDFIGNTDGLAQLTGAAFTGDVSFAGKVIVGDGDQDVMEKRSVEMRTDSRSTTNTYTGGNLTSVVEKAGATTVKTTTLNYDGTGVLTGTVEVASGKTVTTVMQYDGSGVLTGTTRTVS